LLKAVISATKTETKCYVLFYSVTTNSFYFYYRPYGTIAI